MECKNVINIRISRVLSDAFWYADWNVFIFQLLDFKSQRPVSQTQVPLLI